MKDIICWRWRSSSISMGMKDWQVDLCIFCDADAVAHGNEHWEEDEGIKSRMQTVEISFIRKVAQTSQCEPLLLQMDEANLFWRLVRIRRFPPACPARRRPWSRSMTRRPEGLLPSSPWLPPCFAGGAGGDSWRVGDLRSCWKFRSCPEKEGGRYGCLSK